MNPDVLIIGGGLIGLSIARELHKSGVRRITLVEKSICGSESSWAAAGMLGPQAEAEETGPFFDLCCASRHLYPAFAAKLLDETGVNVELDRAGTLYLAFTDDDVREVHRRLKWQHKAGLPVEHFSAEETRRAEPFVSPDVRGALFFPDDWQVENRKLCAALKRYSQLNGIKIRENTLVERLIIENGRVVGAETATERIAAGQTVLATGAWTSIIKLGLADMPFEVAPVRGQMIAFHSDKRLFKHVIYSCRGYIVPRLDGWILAGSTSENTGFDKSVTEAATASLRDAACEIAQHLTSLDIDDRWAGLRPHASDGLPILGPIDGIDSLIIATAHYRNGILLAPLTAKLVAENLVSKKDSEYFRIFAPGRFARRGVGTGR
jgi:glycine oxidase